MTDSPTPALLSDEQIAEIARLNALPYEAITPECVSALIDHALAASAALAERDAFIAAQLPGSGFEALPYTAPKPSEGDLERLVNSLVFEMERRGWPTFGSAPPGLVRDALRAALDALGGGE